MNIRYFLPGLRTPRAVFAGMEYRDGISPASTGSMHRWISGACTRILPVRLGTVRLIILLLLAGFPTSLAIAQSVAPPPPSSNPHITREELGYHVGFLAADSLEGRGTGTKAIDVAAEYLAREFKRYGLMPAGDDGSYFQVFDVVVGVNAGPRNALAIRTTPKMTPATLTSGKDFIPYSFSQSGSVSAEVVFAGWGIRAATLGRDDYAGLDVKDKIVLVLAGNPDGDDPHSQLESVSGTRSKALFAREAGARAVLVVRPDLDTIATLRYDNSPTDAGIIILSVRHGVANALLSTAKLSIAALADTSRGAATVTPQPLPGAAATLTADVSFIHKKARNVIGRIMGTDAAMKDSFLVVGAHFDHLGWGQDGSLYKGDVPMIHNGADDNASGTAGMLELAQLFATTPPRHSMLFMGFSGEEMGLLGSSHWVNHPTVPLKQISAMFNLDMIGRLADSTRKLNVQGTGTSPVWDAVVKAANSYKFDMSLIPDGQGSSDQASFYMKDIPVLFFFTGLHTDYHRPSDDVEKLNLEGEREVTQFAADIIRRIDGEARKLAFTKVAVQENRRMSAFRVYVGTIPDYGATEEGFKISGTSPGGPAEKAGMLAGDVITRFGSTDVKNIYDYMNALSLYKPGDDVKVQIKRGGELKEVTVHLTKK